MPRPSKPHEHKGYWRVRIAGVEIHLGQDQREPIEVQERESRHLRRFAHHWGFGLRRSHWQRMQPLMARYSNNWRPPRQDAPCGSLWPAAVTIPHG